MRLVVFFCNFSIKLVFLLEWWNRSPGNCVQFFRFTSVIIVGFAEDMKLVFVLYFHRDLVEYFTLMTRSLSCCWVLNDFNYRRFEQRIDFTIWLVCWFPGTVLFFLCRRLTLQVLRYWIIVCILWSFWLDQVYLGNWFKQKSLCKSCAAFVWWSAFTALTKRCPSGICMT